MIESAREIIQGAVEATIRNLKRSANAGAVVVVIVHRDGSTQNSACASFGYEAKAIKALRSLADKMEKTPPARVEMRKESQN